ncbi:MAG: hypothetical protein AAF658_14355 [Myxococcota bacterium]
MNNPNRTDETQADLVALEDDPKWGSVLNELDVELSTRVTAMEFDDEWTRPEVSKD